MSTMVFREHSTFKPTSFQAKCDLYNKQSVVMLGLIIPISTFGTNIVLLFFLFSWFLAGNITEKIKIIWKNDIAKMALLLFSVFALGATYSEASKVDVLDQLNKMAKLLYIPFLIPVLREKEWRSSVLLAFVSAMLLTLVLSFLKLQGWLPISNRFTQACVFKDHIYTNLMMALTCFMIGHDLLSETDFLKKLGLGILVLLTAYFVLFMSKGRIGYLLFAALAALLFVQRFSLKGLIIGILLVISLFSLAYKTSDPFREGVLLGKENIQKFQSGDSNTSLGSRLEFYRETWQLSKQHPWFGFGTGSFQKTFQSHATSNQLLQTQNPHNEYLNIFFQLGAMGLLVWLAFLSRIYKKSFSLPDSERWFSQGVLMALAIGCMLNSWVMDFTAGYFFVLMIAVPFAAYNPLREQ